MPDDRPSFHTRRTDYAPDPEDVALRAPAFHVRPFRVALFRVLCALALIAPTVLANEASAQSGTVIASDAFDRANEVPFQVGGDWQKAAGPGVVHLSGNAVVGVDDDAIYAWQGAGPFDDTRQFARARVTQTNGQVGLSLLGASGQAIVVAWNRVPSTVFIYWYSAGLQRTNLATATSTIQAGDVVEAVLLAGRIYAKVNGVVVASASNSTTLSAGRPGFEASGASGGLDDWEGGTPDAYSLSGTILEDASGLEGAFVRVSGLFGATTTSDANGDYAIPNLPAGITSLRIEPLLAGRTMGPTQRIVAGPIAANVVAQDFTATASNHAVVASDDFDRPSEFPLQTGPVWQKAAGAALVDLENDQVSGHLDDAVYFWQGPAAFDDSRQYARARVTQTDGQVGLALLGGNGQAIVVAWNRALSTVFIYWYSAGILRGNLTTATTTIEVGDLLEADLLGGRIYAKRNGVIVASAANSTTLATGRPGFELSGDGGGLDDWEAGTPAAYTLSGTILENAAGLPGVLVRLSGALGATATTDANGAYTIPDLPAGATNLRLKPLRAGYSMTPLERTVAGPIAANVVAQDFAATASTNAVAAFDDFDRPNELPLETSGTWQQAAGGGTTNLAGQALAGRLDDAVYFWQGPGAFDDTRQYARARVTQTDGQVGLALLGGNGQAIVVAWNRSLSTVFIYWYSAGILRGNLTTASATVEVGDILTAELLGGRIYAKRNGIVVASAANSTTLATGRPGFELSGEGSGLDDWEAGTPEAYTLSGTILENAAGLTGVLVRLSGTVGATATTDANGEYTIPNLPAGATNLRLKPLRAGFTMTPLERTVAGPIAANVVAQDFAATASNNAIAAFDDFDRPNELPLETGGIWQKAVGGGTTDLAGQSLAGRIDDAVYFWQGPGSFDDTLQYARAHVTQTDGQVGLALLGGSGQAIVVAWNRALSTVFIYWYSAGILRGNLATATSTIEIGDVLEAELAAGQLTAKVNGTVVASTLNTTTLSSGRPGFETSGVGGGLDDWEAGRPVFACNDGQDNDADLLVDLADPGCTSATDPSEQNASVACDDGLDNDGDLLVDLADPGCANATDASEQNTNVACDDGLDNDGDSLIDLVDPGCANAADASEQNASIACDDGQDNDGDLLVDLADPGCANATDASEQNTNVACDDGLDNDADLLVDLADPGCSNGSDPSEQNASAACDDGQDNDGDTLIDLVDPGCGDVSDTSEQNETVACDDGQDNDGDLLVDWPADPDCGSASDATEDGQPAAVPTLPPVGGIALLVGLIATALRRGARSEWS